MMLILGRGVWHLVWGLQLVVARGGGGDGVVGVVAVLGSVPRGVEFDVEVGVLCVVLGVGEEGGGELGARRVPSKGAQWRCG